MNEDGFYTLTKSVTDLVKMMVQDKILAEQRQWRVRDEDNYNEVREFEEYEENIVSAIDSGAAILQLPQVLSKDLPNCHLTSCKKSQVTSNKMVHMKRHHFPAKFSITFHMV